LVFLLKSLPNTALKDDFFRLVLSKPECGGTLGVGIRSPFGSSVGGTGGSYVCCGCSSDNSTLLLSAKLSFSSG
jgi:hypothetical protein